MKILLISLLGLSLFNLWVLTTPPSLGYLVVFYMDLGMIAGYLFLLFVESSRFLRKYHVVMLALILFSVYLMSSVSDGRVQQYGIASYLCIASLQLVETVIVFRRKI